MGCGRISAKKIAETLAITRERVRHISHEILDMRKLFERPKNNARNGESGSPRLKKFQDPEVIKQGVGSSLWDSGGILHVAYLEEGATIMEKYYVALPRQSQAATGLQTWREAFESNLVSSRQCCS
jgi:hypothetical protein